MSLRPQCENKNVILSQILPTLICEKNLIVTKGGSDQRTTRTIEQPTEQHPKYRATPDFQLRGEFEIWKSGSDP